MESREIVKFPRHMLALYKQEVRKAKRGNCKVSLEAAKELYFNRLEACYDLELLTGEAILSTTRASRRREGRRVN